MIGGNLRLVAFPIHPLPQQLAVTANGFGLFAGLAFGRLLIGTAQLHFPENAFALHLLLQRFQRLIDVIVAYNYVYDDLASRGWLIVPTLKYGFRPGFCRSARLIA